MNNNMDAVAQFVNTSGCYLILSTFEMFRFGRILNFVPLLSMWPHRANVLRAITKIIQNPSLMDLPFYSL